jgi:hypothetical protein
MEPNYQKSLQFFSAFYSISYLINFLTEKNLLVPKSVTAVLAFHLKLISFLQSCFSDHFVYPKFNLDALLLAILL